MTNERAIELLNRISDSQFDGIHGDERREALEMAVRALFSQQTVNDSQGLVNDCISRKMAIDTFEPEHDTDWYTPQIIEVLEALPPVQPTQTNADSTQSNTLDCVSRRAAMIVIENSGLDDDSKDTAVRVLEQLPSAQQHWIPCSERLPDEFGEYLVTKKAIGWNCEEYNSNDIAYFDNEGFHKADKVLAWMPLPKPYGGESDE